MMIIMICSQNTTMLGLSSSPQLMFCSTFGNLVPLEDESLHNSTLHHQPYCSDTGSATTTPAPESLFDQYLPSLVLPQLVEALDASGSYGIGDQVPHNNFKKLNHNASERDRRKKINDLYSSLRSLLPAEDQTKKLSTPSTIARVLKYIPELQNQVEKLSKKKEELLSKLSRQEEDQELKEQFKYQKSSTTTYSPAILATKLNDTEFAVQISSLRANNNGNPLLLSHILDSLEEDGLFLINANSFESVGGTIFYNLHLQVERSHDLESEGLSEKLCSLYEKTTNYLIPSI